MNEEFVLMMLILLSLFVPLTIGYILISYVKSLETKKCACSNNVRRKYIKYYGYVFILSALLGLVTLIAYIKHPPVRIFKNVIKVVILIIHFLAAYVIFTYSKLLEDNSCKCSNSWKRVFLKYYGYLLMAFVCGLFFCLLMSLLILVSSGNHDYVLELKNLLLGCEL